MQHTQSRAGFVAVGLLAVIGCGGDDVRFTAIDAALPDAAIDAPIDAGLPSATYRYVVSSMRYPASAAESSQFGLDIDEVPGDANSGIDNQLGTFFSSLRSIAPGLDYTLAATTAVDRGDLLLLARLVATEPIAPGPALLTFDIGADPIPAACTSPADTTCRHHLAGDGTFTLASGVTPGTPVDGEIVGTTFRGRGGTYVLPMAFADGGAVARVPVVLGTSVAEVRATGIVSGKLGGAIYQADLEARLYPVLQATYADVVDRDCTGLRTPPNCGCVSGSTAASLLSLFDTASPRDCTISLSELTSTFNSLLTADIDANGDGSNDAVSFGFSYTAVQASLRP